jgi:hypothetical protein
VIGPLAEGGLVDKTGPYQMHAGEFVVTASKDNLSIAGGENLTSAELTQIKTVLVDIREQQRRYQEEDARTTKSMESSLKTQAEQQRRANNG